MLVRNTFRGYRLFLREAVALISPSTIVTLIKKIDKITRSSMSAMSCRFDHACARTYWRQVLNDLSVDLVLCQWRTTTDAREKQNCKVKGCNMMQNLHMVEIMSAVRMGCMSRAYSRPSHVVTPNVGHGFLFS